MPVIEIATPYQAAETKAEERRLRVERITDSEVPAWRVSGKIIDQSNVSKSNEAARPVLKEAEDAGRIIIRDQKLVFETRLGVNHRLMEMLENSVLVVMTSDDDTKEPRLFQRIYLSSGPTRSNAVAELSFEVFEEEKKKFGPNVASRVSEVPAENLLWEIECVLQSHERFVLKTDAAPLDLRFFEPLLLE
jgi:hypothetical protein